MFSKKRFQSVEAFKQIKMAISYVLQISYFAMYNHGPAILRLFDALPILYFFFTTSETKRDY